jgi:PIN domain nuclease of toxin-antitoxin system
MISCVLDASAILAYLEEETGSREVEKLLDEAAVSAVNMAEVASKLAERGAPADRIRQTIEALGVEVFACDEAIAYRIGDLRSSTKTLGLSLGDRACLATALQQNVRAITADRHWKTVKVGVRIQVIR